MEATHPVRLLKNQGQIQKLQRQTFSQPKSIISLSDLYRHVDSTIFKTFYERNDLPIVVSFHGAVRHIEWKVDIQMLDLHHYLPIFFEGLREDQDPMMFLADKGIDDLITKG